MYPKRTNNALRKTFSPLKPRSPYGGLLVACLFGLFSVKLVKNKLEEDKINGYGCREHPKKYISSPAVSPTAD